MTTYTLRPRLGAETFHRINQGKKFVGRVWQHATTRQWHGKIGPHEGSGETATRAFDETAARALGFESYAALRDHNAAQARARSRQQRGARLVATGMMSRDRATRDKAYDVFFGIMEGKIDLSK